MSSFLILNILLLLFLSLTIWETKKKIVLPKEAKILDRIPPFYLLIGIFMMFTLVVLFLLFGKESFIYWYIRGVFVFLIFGHAFFLSLGQKKSYQILFFLAALIVVLVRFWYPSAITHNLFILTSFLWIGPLFTKVNLLNQKRFVIISFAWFLYDILFVWLTSSANTLAAKGNSIGFPLAIILNGSFIGSGDLLWANLFVSC